jgi:hypothetical protein
MLMKNHSLAVWALALFCSCFSSIAHANWNNHNFGSDIDYYQENLLNVYGDYNLTDWQYFPDGSYQDGDYTNDQFCLITTSPSGTSEIWYGTNDVQSCSWWTDNNIYDTNNTTYKNYFSELGTVKIDCSNPLNDQSCPGYQEAYFSFMCSTNALYDQACPGYQEAYTLQQCTANSLYDVSCPGYQEAYTLQMLEQERQSGSTAVDDGTQIDDGVPANDGSDIAEYTEPEPSFVEENFGVTVEEEQQATGIVEDDGTGLNLDEQFVQQETTPTIEEPVVVFEEPVVIEEPVQLTEDVQVAIEETNGAPTEDATTALEEANELDLDSMSPREVIGALSALGILGNDQTNGVGDPTGLSNSIEGTGGTISATGQVQSIGGDTSMSGTSSSSGMSDNSGSSMGMTAADSGLTPTTNEQSFGSSADFGGNDMTAQSATAGPTLQIQQGGFGSVKNSPEMSSNGISALEEQMGFNVNPLFDNPALSSGAVQIAGLQEAEYNSLSKRIIRERIQQMITDTKVDTGDDSVKDAEEVVLDSIQESIENKMDELMVDADVNQAEIITLMGVNIEFNEYNNRTIPQADFYGNEDWYKDVEIPQNRSALRNGLAQQILHDKMVDMQYTEDKDDTDER